MTLPPLPKVDPVHLRLALRATLAATLAFALAETLDLPKGYWAVLTAILVMQGTIGASLGAALDRLFGTLLGGALGVVGAWIAGPSLTITGLVLVIGVLVTVYIAAARPSLKLAPVTIAIVLLSDPTHAQPVHSALERLAEIGLGACIGLVTALLFLPSRALDHLREDTAKTLSGCAELTQIVTARLLDQPVENGAVERVNTAIRKKLRSADLRTDEAKRERSGHLADHPDPAPIVRTLRRIWHDELILLRTSSEQLPPALREELGPPLRAAADATVARMQALAAAVLERRAPEETTDLATAVGALSRAVADLRSGGHIDALDAERLNQLFAVPFAFQQIRNSLRDLALRIGEQASKAAVG